MKLYVLDFETTGTDPETCLPLEFGGRTYDTKTRKRGKEFQQLIWEKEYPPISDQVQQLTGINLEMARKGCGRDVFLNMVDPILQSADVLVAYNSKYDQRVLYRIYNLFGMRLPKQPWLCARLDIPYPPRLMKCQQLQHRALDLGLAMDHRDAHRAMADVELLCDIFDLYDMEEVIKWWKRPWVYLQANIPGPWVDGGKGRDLAKAAGFNWEKCTGTDDPVFEKKWVKRVKDFDATEYGFSTSIISGGSRPAQPAKAQPRVQV